ncbi:MAG: PocR ligand-binding domain-containing protein [Oscillospiraceae bacterium]|nr:PocR ligand-binding domain-containing protein [Oscillospiraceae bacterium]
MSQRDWDMRSIFDIPELETMQDSLAEESGLAIITIDYRGIPVTKHSMRTDFCSVIRENPVSRKRCYKCDSLAGLEAVRMDRPFIYLCHCGIVDAAIPVTVGEKYLGAMMLGQVRLISEDSSKVERLISEISSFRPECDSSRMNLMELYNRLPVMDYKTVEHYVNCAASFVRYTVSQAIKRHTEMLSYEYLLRREDQPIQNIRLAEADITKLFPSNSSELPPELHDKELQHIKGSSSIYPAIMYVLNHRKEAVTMRDMADLCHISPSYFSKLFYREVGENFTDWMNRKKVAWSAEMLRNSKESIAHIAAELGFMDTSYFIKVFKKHEGVTPLAYRQYR